MNQRPVEKRTRFGLVIAASLHPKGKTQTTTTKPGAKRLIEGRSWKPTALTEDGIVNSDGRAHRVVGDRTLGRLGT